MQLLSRHTRRPVRRPLRDLNALDHPRGVPNHNNIIRHVLRHYAPRTDRHALADRDTGEDNDVAPDPAVRADGDRPAALGPIRAVAECGVRGVGGAVEGAVGAHESAVADGDGASVEPGAVGVYKDTLAESVRV